MAKTKRAAVKAAVAALHGDDKITEAVAGEPGRLATAEEALAYMMAGNATVTVKSKSGARFTFKLQASEDGSVHFVKLLTGPDNDSDYAYMGIVRNGKYWHGRKSHLTADAPGAKAFDWLYTKLTTTPEVVMAQAEIWHEGHCGRCGRKLTVPESIRNGIGPECARKMGGMA